MSEIDTGKDHVGIHRGDLFLNYGNLKTNREVSEKTQHAGTMI